MNERTYIVTEMCPHCESEITMSWDTDTRGYEAHCPVCGGRLMLCDECVHSKGFRGCDYEAEKDRCWRRAAERKDTMNVILDKGAFMPEFAHRADAGADLRSPICAVVPAKGGVVIDTGVHVEIPEGYVGMLKSKSGLNMKHDLIGTGTIDSGYTGSIHVKLYNLGNTNYCINRGDKIIQMVILPCAHCDFNVVDRFAESERGTGGFGSTGR